MRAALFFCAYWLVSAFSWRCACCSPPWPASAPCPGIAGLRVGHGRGAAPVVGVRIEVHATRNLPAEPAVIAAKHQSWGDGFVMLATIRHLGFVAGDHLYNFPLLGPILKKAGAIVLSSHGGEAARHVLNGGIARLKREARDVLIYPEGRLAAPGEKHRYRSGVWYLYNALNRPCVPVATNLGPAWDRTGYRKTAGTVRVEFMESIQPGLSKDIFMARPEETIERRTDELVAKGL